MRSHVHPVFINERPFEDLGWYLRLSATSAIGLTEEFLDRQKRHWLLSGFLGPMG